MALFNCTECNREISDQAKSCPHCGVSISMSNVSNIPQQVEITGLKFSRPRNLKVILIPIIGIFLLAAIVFSIFVIRDNIEKNRLKLHLKKQEICIFRI